MERRDTSACNEPAGCCTGVIPLPPVCDSWHYWQIRLALNYRHRASQVTRGLNAWELDLAVWCCIARSPAGDPAEVGSVLRSYR